MNIQELDILNVLGEEPFSNQRLLAEKSGHSLGVVNRCLRALAAEGYVNDAMQPTEKARVLFDERRPKSAVILAAGTGMRMVPINLETPKGLLEVHGEPLIERLICQLHSVGVHDIYVVVGFMKEQYEYLIDKYGVQLIVSTDFAQRNNLHSLALALDHLSNSYILPCDIWCAANPFRRRELYSWYLVTDEESAGSGYRVNRKRELVTDGSDAGCTLTGAAYVLEPEAAVIRERIRALAANPRYNSAWWEEAIYEKDCMLLPARVVPAAQIIEINTYEQLRELDSGSGQLRSDAIDAAARVLGAAHDDIQDIDLVKKGRTNRSFLFTCKGGRYIMRIPGDEASLDVDRVKEGMVYDAIRGKGLCDDPLYFDASNGYKLTAFLDPMRECDAEDPEDVRKCMALLRRFHELKLTIPYAFDVYEQIEYYESCWHGAPSAYRDYAQTKANVLSLKEYIDAHAAAPCLTHIDANPDNFLFTVRDGQEQLQLIDWEYAAVTDPHADIAIFGIHALYGREKMEQLIDAYFPEGCPPETRVKIYCMISAYALWNSNWCEWKQNLGAEFGRFSIVQYRLAKEYYKIAKKAMEALACTR